MRFFLIWGFCHLLAIAVAPSIWRAGLAGYPGDSFWTLNDQGRVGVLVIALVGLFLVALLNAWKTRGILRRTRYRWRVLVWAIDVVLSLAVLAAIYILSPQVFYAFYQQIIPGLPTQWVVDSAANWEKLRTIVAPPHTASLADHGASVAMGGTILFTSYLHRRGA